MWKIAGPGIVLLIACGGMAVRQWMHAEPVSPMFIWFPIVAIAGLVVANIVGGLRNPPRENTWAKHQPHASRSKPKRVDYHDL